MEKIFNLIKEHKDKIYIGLIVFLLIPILVVAFYNHPYYDDFAYSIDTYNVIKNNGNIFQLLLTAFNTSMEFMNNWQGLYSSAFLLALQPSIFGEGFYSLTTFIIFGIMFIGIFMFYKAIYKNILKSNSSKYFLLSLLTLFLLVETTPFPREAFFWFNGAVNYIFFWGLLLIICAMYINMYFNKEISWFNVLGISFWTFILSGGNHVTAFAGLLIEFFFLIFTKKKKYFGLPFISGIVGFLINVMAPGTRVRADMLDINIGITQTVFTTFKKSFGFFSNWNSIAFILFIIAILFLTYEDIKKIKIKYNWKFLVIPFISYMLLAGMLCVPYYALGSYGAGRVTDTIYFTFVIVAIVNILILFKFLIDNKCINLNNLIKKIDYRIMFLLGIFIIVFIGFFGNSVDHNSTSVEACRELLKGEVQKFSQENYDRLSMYLDNKLEEVVVSPFTSKPYLLYGSDVCQLSEDSDCTDAAINKYYHKKVIRVKDKNIE